MSATLTYDATTSRMHVAGSCRDEDSPAIREALSTYGRMAQDLTVDLTEVEELSPTVAEVFADGARAARQDGRDIIVDCVPDSPADREILAAASRTQRPQPPE